MKNFLEKHYVEMGPQYVFFQSLASESLDIYHHYYGYGKGLLNSAKSMLTGENNLGKSEEDLTNIRAYIEMIGKAAMNAQTIEINFFYQIKSMVKNNALKNKIDFFLNNTKENFNYLQFIKLLNDIMLENNKLNQEIQEKYLHNMELYNQIYQEAPEELKKIWQESYENFTRDNKGNIIYSTQMQKILRDRYAISQENSDKIETQVNSILTNTMNKGLNALYYNDDLRNKITSDFIEAGIKEQEIQDYLLGAIVKFTFDANTINNLSNLTGEQIIQSISQNLKSSKDLSTLKEYANQAVKSVEKKMHSIRSIEDLALTTGKNVGRAYLQLTDEEKEKLKKDYGIILNPEIEKNKKGQSLLRYYTQELVKGIRKYYSENNPKLLKDLEQVKNKTLTAEKRKALKDIRQQIQVQARKLQEDKIKEAFSVKFTTSSVSELLLGLGGQYLSELLKNPKLSKPHKIGEIQVKTDAIINFFSNDLVTNLEQSIREDIFHVLDESTINFVEKYHEKSGGEINVEAAEKAFREEQQLTEAKITNILKKIGKSHDEINDTLNNLSNFISQSISVKDYNIYLNEEGFHAQSLGANTEKVIDNILKMYDLGGLSTFDKNLLIFAVNNCSELTIGGNSLKKDLATFLLGGAALITFDDGFTLLQNYIESFKDEFHTTKMLLYNLQGKFIPASYVLFAVYNNLQKIYGNIEQELYSISKDTNKVLITNTIDYLDIPDYYIVPNAQDRWNIVSELIKSKTLIKMEFMAGLLDIFKQLPNAFDI